MRKKLIFNIHLFKKCKKKSAGLISAGIIRPELRRFWPELQKSGFTEKSCAGPDPARVNLEKNLPARVSGFPGR